MRVVATAGHVDHGKSTLVLALTGTDPDRLAEEKERGLTIDLGYAFTTLPSGAEVGFVDVPGHVRFLKNMLAGVGAVDLVLFVVSARDGWMPQSEEHLVILALLGIRHGVVVLTNGDTIDTDQLDTAQLVISERLSRSSLRDAAIVVCDSVSGRGLDDVRAALDAALVSAPPAHDADRSRLWIDRVFAPRGAGTVVTGTLVGGTVTVGDALEIGATGDPARVRGIETAHRHVERAAPGTRVALNLAGVERSALQRGDALVRPGQWTATSVVDVTVVPAPGEQLRGRSRLQAYVGSGEHEVWCQVLDDTGALARVRFLTPIPLAPGDRVVLRDAGRECTVAGAEVLDVEPTGAARDALSRLRLPREARLLARTGRVLVADIGRLTGLSAPEADALAASMVASGRAVRVGGSLVDRSWLLDRRERAREAVRATSGADLATLTSTLEMEAGDVRVMVEGDEQLVLERGFVRAVTQSAIDASPEAVALVSALDASPFSPPDPSTVGADPALVGALVRHGVLVDIGGVVFTQSAVDRAREFVREHLATHDTMTVGDARDRFASSRKYVVPLLEHFDREGVTRRRGDVRIAGPTHDTNRRQQSAYNPAE